MSQNLPPRREEAWTTRRRRPPVLEIPRMSPRAYSPHPSRFVVVQPDVAVEVIKQVSENLARSTSRKLSIGPDASLVASLEEADKYQRAFAARVTPGYAWVLGQSLQGLIKNLREPRIQERITVEEVEREKDFTESLNQAERLLTQFEVCQRRLNEPEFRAKPVTEMHAEIGSMAGQAKLFFRSPAPEVDISEVFEHFIHAIKPKTRLRVRRGPDSYLTQLNGAIFDSINELDRETVRAKDGLEELGRKARNVEVEQSQRRAYGRERDRLTVLTREAYPLTDALRNAFRSAVMTAGPSGQPLFTARQVGVNEALGIEEGLGIGVVNEIDVAVVDGLYEAVAGAATRALGVLPVGDKRWLPLVSTIRETDQASVVNLIEARGELDRTLAASFPEPS